MGTMPSSPVVVLPPLASTFVSAWFSSSLTISSGGQAYGIWLSLPSFASCETTAPRHVIAVGSLESLISSSDLTAMISNVMFVILV